MSFSNKVFTIIEYGSLTRVDTEEPGYQPIPVKAFDAIEALILTNSTSADNDKADFLSLSVRRGIGKVITARNYVGLITSNDGTTIEILPKISSGIGIPETRRVFLEMLSTLKDVPFKAFNSSRLGTDRMSLLEIFIRMFLDEVTVLMKQGLKSSYNIKSGNERFFKGKLLVSENFKHNSIRRERFFVAYDEFSLNRPENRLIKSTLRHLLRQSHDEVNRRTIMLMQPFFEVVDVSADIRADLSRCMNDRSMSHYRMVINLCKVFLLGNSFSAFAGREVAIALLFPMDKVFESYVSSRIKKALSNSLIEVRTQDSQYSLFDTPTKAFTLCPDIVISDGSRTVVMDTKWKMLRSNAQGDRISQSDMYQMYAYSRKYSASSVRLVYPFPGSIPYADKEYISKKDDVRVSIEFVDLTNPERDIDRLSRLV